ncbi:MAG: S9 family peptidase [Chloroflexales bacterium]|nr:S9 family peptidase [Chloroflexales bacterium]
MSTPTAWNISDVAHISFIESVAWSPDGANLAYVIASPDSMANKYRRSIWLRRGNAAPRRFSAGTAGDRSPVWSPDGQWLAFVSNRGGDAQIYVIAVDGGEAEAITAIPTGASSPVWSPDGQYIAFVSSLNRQELDLEANPLPAPPTMFFAEQQKAFLAHQAGQAVDPRVMNELPFRTGTDYIDGRRSHIYLVEVAKGPSSVRRVTKDKRDYFAPAWSHDGLSLWSVAKRDVTSTSYFVGRSLVQILLDEKNILAPVVNNQAPWSIASAPQISPDGQWLAATASHYDAPFYGGATLLVRPVSGGDWRPLDCQDTTIGEWRWLPDSRGIAYVAEWHGRGTLRTVFIGADAPMVLAQPAIDAGMVIADFAINQAGDVAYSVGGPQYPCELWLASKSSVTQLSQLYSDLLTQRVTVAFEEIWYPSHDGAMVQGWLLAPPIINHDQQYGLILHIHGGPHAMWSPGTRAMWLEWQATAAAGFYVFFCNPRGSEGYGAAWQAGTKARWGVADQPDFEAGIDAVLAKGLQIDPAKVGVTGGSYGGFMTTWLIGHSKRFAAAVSARGVYNLITEHSMSDAYELVEYSFDMVPWRDAAALWQASPIAAVADMKAPLLILHSELDFRVPIGEAEQLYTMLRRLGRTVEFVRYPREGHELTRSGEPLHQMDHMRRTIDWFIRFLQK